MKVDLNDLITSKEVGDILNWSTQKVREYRVRGVLPEPVGAVGGRPVWLKSHIIRYKELKKI